MAETKTETELRFQLMDNFADIFGVQRWGIYLFNAENELTSSDAYGVSDRFIARNHKIGISVDPVLEYVSNYHAPAHEELVIPQGRWKQSQLYQRCCVEYRTHHARSDYWQWQTDWDD